MNPRVTVSSKGRTVIQAAHFAYPEIEKIDPLGHGKAWSEIVPGQVTRLSPTVQRVAAPNPGFMTGPGTNSYIVGTEEECAVIDPGPSLEEHIALLHQTGGRAISLIITTHTHSDHSPGARRLRELTGAQVIGMPAPDTEFQDKNFSPDRVPEDGERIQIGGCTLRVIHTPGHASNHCCYLLEEERMLFTGDHIMQGSTVVINPPDGDMALYLASLRKIQKEPVDWLAPGHGFLMNNPVQRIDHLLAHRQAREDKVLKCLGQAQPISAQDLVPLVYDDVPPQRFAMALRSLNAHLHKLLHETRATEHGGLWRLA